jgi:hypothetical protein
MALRHVFKEWAVICHALGTGRQSLILRKGGIAEGGSHFRVEHDRFWLYPTWVHQQMDGIIPDARLLLEQAMRERPAEGALRLSYFAEVEKVYEVKEPQQAERLSELHCWSPEAVRTKFHYRQPGLWVLAVRVWRATYPHDLPEHVAYAGCRSWVELDEELSTEGAIPVLPADGLARVVSTLGGLLGQ